MVGPLHNGRSYFSRVHLVPSDLEGCRVPQVLPRFWKVSKVARGSRRLLERSFATREELVLLVSADSPV